MSEVKVLVGVTRCVIACSKKGNVDGTSANIFPFLKRTLIEYEQDPRLKVWKIGNRYFKFVDGFLFIPIAYLTHLINFLNNVNVRVVKEFLSPSIGDDVVYKFKGTFKDRDYQVPMIKFLSSADNRLRALEMQTGKGKTYCSIRAFGDIGKRVLVVVPANLIDQWFKALDQILKLKDEVFVIRGSQSIEELDRLLIEKRPSIILASLTTLQVFINNNDDAGNLEALQQLIERAGIGVKVIDECHKNFNANLMIDLAVDVGVNLYLSATYMRTNKQSNRIFNTIFNDNVKFGLGDLDKYIDVYECQYTLRKMHDKRVCTIRGYSQAKFEKQILKFGYLKDPLFYSIIPSLVRDHFITDKRKGHKLLILVGLKDFAYELSDVLSIAFKGVKVQPFLAEHSDDVLKEADIIVSTVGSCGTGKDIKGLKTCILFTSFGSSQLTYQTIGRLRKMDGGYTPEFIYMVCTNIEAHQRHAQKKRFIYKKLAKNYRMINM